MTDLPQKIASIIKKLDLIPHPEGGFYRETYRSEDTLKGSVKNVMSSIYFLLTSDHISHLHRISSDENWYYHGGSPLVVHTLDAFGHHEHIVGNDLEKGYYPHFVVPKNTIFASTVLEENSYSLVSCAVAPGFDFSDFELFKQDELIRNYPMYEEIIRKLAIK